MGLLLSVIGQFFGDRPRASKRPQNSRRSPTPWRKTKRLDERVRDRHPITPLHIGVFPRVRQMPWTPSDTGETHVCGSGAGRLDVSPRCRRSFEAAALGDHQQLGHSMRHRLLLVLQLGALLGAAHRQAGGQACRMRTAVSTLLTFWASRHRRAGGGDLQVLVGEMSA